MDEPDNENDQTNENNGQDNTEHENNFWNQKLFTFFYMLNNLPRHIFSILWFLNILFFTVLHSFIKTSISVFIILFA